MTANFKVVGDDIYYDGTVVATFVRLKPSFRCEVESELQTAHMKEEYEDLESELSGVAAELDAAKQLHKDAESETKAALARIVDMRKAISALRRGIKTVLDMEDDDDA